MGFRMRGLPCYIPLLRLGSLNTFFEEIGDKGLTDDYMPNSFGSAEYFVFSDEMFNNKSNNYYDNDMYGCKPLKRSIEYEGFAGGEELERTLFERLILEGSGNGRV